MKVKIFTLPIHVAISQPGKFEDEVNSFLERVVSPQVSTASIDGTVILVVSYEQEKGYRT